MRVEGVLAKGWALREWYAHLLYSLPLAALCSALIAFVVIRLLRRTTGLDRDLRLGNPQDELALEYQPIIDLDSGRCVAAEALLRWRHPVHGNVRPDLFIPLAEDTGLIGPLTEWVVRRALLEQEPLLQRFPDLRLSINCPTSSAGLRRTGADPAAGHGWAAASRQSRVRSHRARVRRRGRRLTQGGDAAAAPGRLQVRARRFWHRLFEFRSSRRVRVRVLKIDRSFVQAIGASTAMTSIFDTLVDLAATLGMVTVAEGVETDEQRRHVQRRGVALAQGWLFGLPQPITEFAQHWPEARSDDFWRHERRVQAAGDD